MADQPGGEFRGRIQHTGGPGTPADWSWDRIDDDRPRLPLIGVFLIILGAVLILGQVFPGVRFAGSGLVVAVGIVMIALWATRRVGVVGLYAGMILTALSLPNLLRDLGVIAGGNGWGTLFLGLGFIAIALLRASNRGGTGWQLIVGGVLAALGAIQVFGRELLPSASLDGLLWPLLILVAGVWLISRSRAGGFPGR
jgi:hypothetical protein